MNSYIFDVDGTIWDSTAEVAEAWQAVCAGHGIEASHITKERLKSEFGKRMEDIGFSLFPDMDKERAIRLMQEICLRENDWLLIHPPKVYKEIPELFHTLSRKAPLFIVSNCQAGYIEVLLEVSGLGKFVTDHLCPGDTGLEKAANIAEIVRRYNLTEPCYIGDTMGDFTASRKAGVPFVFAEYGFGQVPAPDYTISSPLKLLEL